MKLDASQSKQRTVLDQISTTSNMRLDDILDLMNDELTPPLRMRVGTETGRVLNIDAIVVQTFHQELTPTVRDVGHKRKKTLPPINGQIPSFTGATITFPSTSGGSITTTGSFGSATYTLTVASGNYIKVGILINETGVLSLVFGAAGASEATATLPDMNTGAFPIGYIVLNNDGGAIQPLISQNIYQFVGGGGSGSGGGTSLDRITQASHGLVVGDILYLNGSTYTKAVASAANTAEVIGVVSKVSSVNTFELTVSGEITGLTGLTPGGVYFLSAVTPGLLTLTEPSVVGQVSLPVGVASSTTTLYVAPKRGVVVGGTNVRTQISLANAATTTIQNASAYDAGELSGWVFIDATTDLRFYIQAQFAKNGAGTDYNLSYQTTGNTPPAGFNITITTAGLVQVTLPSIAGFISANVNFALNAPAVGVTLPLNIDSSNVSFGIVRAKDVNGISIRNAGDTITNVFVSDAGNVGIGTASLSSYGHGGTSKFIQVQNSDTSLNAQAHCIINSGWNSAGVSSIGSLSWALPNVTPADKLSAYVGATTEGGHTLAVPNVALAFATRNTALGPTERMRIDASGNALHNTTTAPSILSSTPVLTLKHSAVAAIWGVGPTNSFGNFYISTGTGGVFLAGGGTAWQAVSDERMKKNIEPLELGLEQIKALKPTRFDYIDEESENSSRVGFIAQEVLSVLPHAVHVPEDAEQMMGVSATEMIPVLVKAIQEQQSIIEKLEARLAALENK